MRTSKKIGSASSPDQTSEESVVQIKADTDTQLQVFAKQSVHPVGTDPWWVVGFQIVVALNNIFLLGYPYLILVPLGWYGGTFVWFGIMLLAYHCNTLVAAIHEFDGVRHIRHRDLARHIYGPFMQKIVFFFQYSNLYVGNIGTIVAGGQTLKALYVLYAEEARIHLGVWIAITGVCFTLFAFCVPHFHALRLYSSISVASSAIYGGIALVIAIQNGLDSPPRDYLVKGSLATRVFKAIAAITVAGYSFNTTILPELQSTIRSPTDVNMYKALRMQVFGSNPIFMGLAFVGYWAYGSSVDFLLLGSLRGPKTWLAIANAAAFVQSIIVFQLYATPIYEYMDTKLGKQGSKEWAPLNMTVRALGRCLHLIGSTFLGALFPLFGDFVLITAATTIWPVEFVLANHMYLKVKTELGTLAKLWHWMLVVVTSLFTVAAVAASVRYVIVDSIYYKAFANL